MRVLQIDVSVLIYLEQEIICQCGFNIIEEATAFSFKSTDGGEFVFRPSYTGGKECDVQVSYMREGVVLDTRGLSVYINRTKCKWKRVSFGEFDLAYVCSRHEWDTEQLTKQQKKQRRKSLGQDVTGGKIYYAGNTSRDDS